MPEALPENLPEKPKDIKKELKIAQDIYYNLTSWEWYEDLPEEMPEEAKEEARANEVKNHLLPGLIARKNVFMEAFKEQEAVLFDFVQMASRFNIHCGDKEDKKKLNDFGEELIAEVAPDVAKNIKWFDPLFKIQAINILSRSADEERRKIGLNAMALIQDETLEKGLLGKFESFFEGFILIRDNGTEEQKNKFAEIARTTAMRFQDQDKYGKIIAYLIKNQSFEVIADGFDIMYSTLNRYGLPPDISDAWKISCPDFDQAIEKNLSAIIQLENKQPGICKFLYKEFNIADFGRYPLDLLLKQYEEINNLDNPHGVILFPRNDWNGAFYQDNFALGEFYKKLQGKFSLRAFECEGKIGIARALIKLNKKYNPPNKKGHKISLAIIGGHGTENSIQFGGKEEINILHAKDFMGRGVQRTSEFFEKNPTFLLFSCSTGVENGIGQKLSETMNAKVVAPKIPTNISEIQVGMRPGREFRFSVKYFDKGEKDVRSVYAAGLKKED